MDAFTQIYLDFLKHKKWAFDQSQFDLATKLNEYAYAIDSWHNPRHKLLGFLKLSKKPKTRFRGMYIWGDVGRGKSVLLNLFHDNLATSAKKRSHFHEFMLTTHRELEALRKTTNTSDPIKQYASELARMYRVLILDEVQINNIADAMIVGRLFSALIDLGTLVFFSSNRIPIDLFKDGLQRELFLPFIELIKSKLDVFNLDNSIDYRLQNLELTKGYFYPINTKNRKALNYIIQSLTGNQPLYAQTITIAENHSITALNSYGHIAVFTFKELCEVEHGVLDYLALCSQFNLIILTDIPKLTPSDHNELLRFITLIDCLYEKRIKLICLSDCKIEAIYKAGRHAFEFKRTVSRLKEMNSKPYFQSSLDGFLPMDSDS